MFRHLEITSAVASLLLLTSVATASSASAGRGGDAYPDAFAMRDAHVTAAPLRRARLVLCADPPCARITTILYGIDPAGSLETFAFDTGDTISVVLPGDTPSGADGLAVFAPERAFWVSALGLDLIVEFDPTDGSTIAGAFPIPAPGTARATDGLAAVAPGRLFSLNYEDDTLYEIDADTGAVIDSLDLEAGAIGALAGGVGRLFAVLDFTSIAEIDPDTGALLATMPAPDLDDDGTPDALLGLAFDGTHLFTASSGVAPPNVAALDPVTGELIALSPFLAPSGTLSGLAAVASVCGDGRTSPLEVCDDGNTVDDDGCDSNCTNTGCGNGIVTSGEECDTAGESPECDVDCTTAACGDGEVNAARGEGCDDGGSADGDGCDAGCRVEVCHECVGAPSSCRITADTVCFVDGNTCIRGTCSAAGACEDAVVLPDGVACDDDSRCTRGDRCSAGACVPGPLRDCGIVDGPCTVGRCDESTGACIGDVEQLDGRSCEDGFFCTAEEVCTAGMCSGRVRDCSGLADACSVGACDEESAACQAIVVVGAEECSDENDCTDDRCDALLGCINLDNASPCDDADPCTVIDQCSAGRCRGEVRGCEDGNDCTFDECETGFGCRHIPVLDACTDLNRCTAGDTCMLGVCTGAPVAGCERTCGDMNGDGAVTVTDALILLLVVVTADVCDPVECDVDANSQMTTTDALILLRFITDIDDQRACPEPDLSVDAGPEGEPNDTLADATAIRCPSFQTVGAEVDPPGDVDFYSFDALEGQIIAIDIDAQLQGSALDSVLGVLDNDGAILITSDDAAAPGEPRSLDSYLEFVVPRTGTYFIGVTSCCDADFSGGSGIGSYVMRCAQRDFTATTLPSTSTTTSTVPSIP